MDAGRILCQLSDTNPWWRGDQWSSSDPDLRAWRESGLKYEPPVLDGLAQGGLYLLRGPRRVGKSTSIKLALRRLVDLEQVQPLRCIYFACDGLSAADVKTLGQVGRSTATAGATGPRFWFLDEITGVSGWAEAVKWLRDTTAMRDDCVVLSGSSGAAMLDAAKALAGRRGPAERSDRLLMPMDFASFARRATGVTPPSVEIDPADLLSDTGRRAIETLIPWLGPLADAFDAYLLVGGFPTALRDFRATGAPTQALVDSLFDVLHGEAVRRGAGITFTLRLLSLISESIGSLVNWSTWARKLDVPSHHAVRAEIEALSAAHYTWICYQETDGSPAPLGNRKVYFTDPLLARLAHLRQPAVAEPHQSALAEQVVGFHLLMRLVEERARAYLDFATLFLERTSSQEIDFVVPREPRLAVESKYVDAPGGRDAAPIEARFGQGILATRSALDLDRPVRRVPAAMLAWLLSRPESSERISSLHTR
jgi:predicted AAA+ superfamily ATPase